jgi:hypothetical protein
VRFLILFFEHPIDEPPPFWGPKSKRKRKAARDEKNENDSDNSEQNKPINVSNGETKLSNNSSESD